MSLEKIAELNKLAQQMEEMKTKAIGEITDRKELRIQAIKKIQAYLVEVSKATKDFSWTAKTNTTIYWLIKQDEVHKYGGVEFIFRKDGTVDVYQSSASSHLEIKNFTNVASEEFFEKYDTSRWREGYIKLIENWHEIKPQIEASAEKSLLERMNKTQQELADFKASYETVVKFEV